MGLFDFVKDAGAKLLGRPTAAEKEQAAEEQAKALAKAHAEALAKAVSNLGLGVDGFSVEVNGDVAVLRGTAPDQATRERVVLAVGNVAGIAQVDDQMEVETPEPEAVFYTVVSGDSLSKIAKAHYGNAMKYPVIFEANKPMLSHPDKIYPGQVLRIPPVEDE